MVSAPDATTPLNGRGASRLSFAKITDTLTVPDLLALQTESFDWLVGNDVWKARLAEGQAQGRTDLAVHSGLGYTLWNAYNYFDYPAVFAAMIVTGVCGLLSDVVLQAITRKPTQWHAETGVRS